MTTAISDALQERPAFWHRNRLLCRINRDFCDTGMVPSDGLREDLCQASYPLDAFSRTMVDRNVWSADRALNRIPRRILEGAPSGDIGKRAAI
jgi:hypothetical protein